jgi:hypothetical protein
MLRRKVRDTKPLDGVLLARHLSKALDKYVVASYY